MKKVRLAKVAMVMAVAALCAAPQGGRAQGWDWGRWDRDRTGPQRNATVQTPAARTMVDRLATLDRDAPGVSDASGVAGAGAANGGPQGVAPQAQASPGSAGAVPKPLSWVRHSDAEPAAAPQADAGRARTMQAAPESTPGSTSDGASETFFARGAGAGQAVTSRSGAPVSGAPAVSAPARAATGGADSVRLGAAPQRSTAVPEPLPPLPSPPTSPRKPASPAVPAPRPAPPAPTAAASAALAAPATGIEATNEAAASSALPAVRVQTAAPLPLTPYVAAQERAGALPAQAEPVVQVAPGSPGAQAVPAVKVAPAVSGRAVGASSVRPAVAQKELAEEIWREVVPTSGAAPATRTTGERDAGATIEPVRPYVEVVPSRAARAAEQPASVSAQTEATVTMLAPRGDASRTGEAGLSDPQVEHFLRVAMYDRDEQEFHRGRGLPGEPAPRVLTRWEGDVAVRVAGDAAPEALALVRAAVRRVDGALPINGGVHARMAEQGGNVAVYVFPRAPSRDVEAYSTLRHDGARITGGEIVLYQDLLTEKVVVREFLRVLGLPGEDAKLPGTVLAPVATGASGKRAAIGPLPDLDADALRILYGPTLRAGMNIEQVRTALR